MAKTNSKRRKQSPKKQAPRKTTFGAKATTVKAKAVKKTKPAKKAPKAAPGGATVRGTCTVTVPLARRPYVRTNYPEDACYAWAATLGGTAKFVANK
jgi:hypothetical protein